MPRWGAAPPGVRTSPPSLGAGSAGGRLCFCFPSFSSFSSRRQPRGGFVGKARQCRGISGGRMGLSCCRDLQEEEGPRSRRHAGRGRGFRANPDPASASRGRAPSPNRPKSREKGLGDEEAAARECSGL